MVLEKLQKALICDWRCIIKRGIFALLIPLISIIYPVLNKYNPNVKVLITFIDNLIPFNKYFIIFYVTWYGYVGIFSYLSLYLLKRRLLETYF